MYTGQVFNLDFYKKKKKKRKWSSQRNLIILDFHIILNCRIFFTSIVSRIYAYSMHIYYSYFFLLIYYLPYSCLNLSLHVCIFCLSILFNIFQSSLSYLNLLSSSVLVNRQELVVRLNNSMSRKFCYQKICQRIRVASAVKFANSCWDKKAVRRTSFSSLLELKGTHEFLFNMVCLTFLGCFLVQIIFLYFFILLVLIKDYEGMFPSSLRCFDKDRYKNFKQLIVMHQMKFI